MDVFWSAFTRPVLELIPRPTIVEVGSSSGINTKKILEFCKAKGSFCHIIDPLEIGNIDEIRDDLASHGRHHMGLSLDFLSKIGLADAYLIDGDHNWYTVYNEIKLIMDMIRNSDGSLDGQRAPVIFFHDVEWPYARRDLYYDAGTIPPEFRKPYQRGGIVPGQSELSDCDGMNHGLEQAKEEGGPRNGVLTAIEDAIREQKLLEIYDWYSVPSFHGLGCLFPKLRFGEDIRDKARSILRVPEQYQIQLEALESRRLEAIFWGSRSQLELNDWRAAQPRKDRELRDLKSELIELKCRLKLIEESNSFRLAMKMAGFARLARKVFNMPKRATT